MARWANAINERIMSPDTRVPAKASPGLDQPLWARRKQAVKVRTRRGGGRGVGEGSCFSLPAVLRHSRSSADAPLALHLQTWDSVCAPIFESAGVKAPRTVTKKSGQAREEVEALSLEDLAALDGLAVVGGDGEETRHPVTVPSPSLSAEPA